MTSGRWALRRIVCFVVGCSTAVFVNSGAAAPAAVQADRVVSAGAEAPLEILYVNSNTGAAAGGHVALKLGDDVFHYQFFPDGRFLLVRESWGRFRLIYNRLRNRSIYSAGLSLSSRAHDRIRRTFLTTLAVQRRDLHREERLVRTTELLDELGSGAADVAVEGAGFFAGQGEASVTSQFGATLRTALDKNLGSNYLAEQRELASQSISGLIEGIHDPTLTLARKASLIGQVIDLSETKTTLDLLHEGAGLRDSAVMSGSSSRQLNEEQLRRLSGLLDASVGNLTDLVRSSGPGRGLALLLEAARCHALALSLREKMLITLDPFPDDAPTRAIDFTDKRFVAYLEDLNTLLDKQLDVLLARLATPEAGNSALLLTQLENVNGKRIELSRALENKSAVRLAPEFMVPSRSARIPVEEIAGSPVRQQPIADLTRYQKQQLADQQTRINRKYSYQLVNHNCVNELLRALNESFADRGDAAHELGAYIDPVADRIVIPDDFFYRASRGYRVEYIRTYPSRRLEALAALWEVANEDTPFSLWPQEGNTLTSTLYDARSEDTPFLFFTDDIVWARPPLGLANLLWSTFSGLGGVLMLPVDGGEQFHQAMRGIVYSLPELVFFNIRKGTYGYDDLSTRTGGL